MTGPSHETILVFLFLFLSIFAHVTIKGECQARKFIDGWTFTMQYPAWSNWKLDWLVPSGNSFQHMAVDQFP